MLKSSNDSFHLEDLQSMTKDQLIEELIKQKSTKPGQKRVRSERGWSKQGVHFFKQQEFEIVMELSKEFPVAVLCRLMNVNRSGFYKWKKRLEHPSKRLLSFVSDLALFKEYHAKYPSHGYRWA